MQKKKKKLCYLISGCNYKKQTNYDMQAMGIFHQFQIIPFSLSVNIISLCLVIYYQEDDLWEACKLIYTSIYI